MQLFINKQKKTKGFTLIELLVVIAIISILSSIVLVMLQGARTRAKNGKAIAEIAQFGIAVYMLEIDTGLYPTEYTEELWIELDLASAGITSRESGDFPGWKGPYIDEIPLDPWGKKYYFYETYPCAATIKGCEAIGSTTTKAVVSLGPDGIGRNSDDLVRVISE